MSVRAEGVADCIASRARPCCNAHFERPRTPIAPAASSAMEASTVGSRASVQRKTSNLLGGLNRYSTGGQSTTGARSEATIMPDGEAIPPLPPTPGLETLRATIQKRLTTWGYLRRVHESRAHWMNTYLFGREELEHALSRSQIGGVYVSLCSRLVLRLSKFWAVHPALSV